MLFRSHSFGVGLELSFPCVVEFDQLEHRVDAGLNFPSRDLKEIGVKPQQFLGSEELVIICLLRKVSDPLAGDGLPDIRSKDSRRAAGGGHETQQHIHRRGFTRTVGAEEAKDLSSSDGQIQALESDLRGLTKLAALVFNPQVLDCDGGFHRRMTR